jgi:hypothetical protein
MSGNARDHAVTASQYLANIDAYADQLRTLDNDQRLQMIATGGFTRVNADQEWTAKLALAHALAAIALKLTESDA